MATLLSRIALPCLAVVCAGSTTAAEEANAGQGAAASSPAAATLTVPLGRVADGTVRDRLWVWAHDARFYGGGCGLPGTSRITPVEGAAYLGVPNLLFIQYQGVPEPPFEPYYVPFQALKRVYWTLSNNGNQVHRLGPEQEHVFRLAAANPNIVGLLLDDFLIGPAGGGGPWLADNDPTFPVTLTVELPAAVQAEALEITQSDWRTGDYRSGRVAVDVSPDGVAWREVGTVELPDEAAAVAAVPLPAEALRGLRLRVLSTYDQQGAHSCGLRRLRLLRAGQPLPVVGARLSASSEFPGHAATELLPDLCGQPTVVQFGAQLGLDDLAAARQQMAEVGGRRLDFAVVVYAHQLDPAIVPLVAPMDTVLFWTWSPADLVRLEASFRRLRQLLPDKRVLLGCYLWDFDAGRPLPPGAMEHQCTLGLQWLKSGQIEGLIFLGTNVCDLGLEAVAWTRRWIAEHGEEPLAPPPPAR